MSKQAAFKYKRVIEGYQLWDNGSIDPFLGDDPQRTIAGILNEKYGKIFNHGDV
jgi:hypothetical protein